MNVPWHPEVEVTFDSLKPHLKDLSVEDLVAHFMDSSKRMKQLDRIHYSITVNESGEREDSADI